jgi:16S rRNA (guanine966-N2)-methyltransferase
MRIIAGKWGGRRIEAPKGAGVRPTTDRVREAWMSALHLRLPGATILDLFSGTGALGLEALSRGAVRAVFVERASASIRALRRNVDTLGAEEGVEIVRGDALSYVAGLEDLSFDLAFADPPYDTGFAGDLIRMHLRKPFAHELWVEHRWSEQLPDSPGLRTRRYGDTALTQSVCP